MQSISTSGPKWGSDRRSSQCPSSPSVAVAQPRTCMINTSNNNNSPSSSTCQWALRCARAARRGRVGGGCWRVWGGTCVRMHCAQNPCRAAHEHASVAPTIMVNTSNSISFLDSWSLDRHDSDSTWFLAGCLPLQLPHFFFIPYEVCLGGYGTCCQKRFSYILPFFCFL